MMPPLKGTSYGETRQTTTIPHSAPHPRALRRQPASNSQQIQKDQCTSTARNSRPSIPAQSRAGTRCSHVGSEPEMRTCGSTLEQNGPSRIRRYLCQTREAAGLSLALLPYLLLQTRTDGPRWLLRRCDTSWALAALRSLQDSPRFLFLVRTFD